MNIHVTVDDAIVPGMLNDSIAAKGFASMLPLTLELSDFHGTEKIADLPRRLSTAGAPAGISAKAGDLAYYAPWGSLAIFYRDFPHSEGLISLGHLDGSLAPLTASVEGPTVTIAIADRRAAPPTARRSGSGRPVTPLEGPPLTP